MAPNLSQSAKNSEDTDRGEQARPSRSDDRRREHANDALRLLERLRHASKNGERYVRLKGEPLELQPLADGDDWFERKTGKWRPQATDDLPLFAKGER